MAEEGLGGDLNPHGVPLHLPHLFKELLRAALGLDGGDHGGAGAVPRTLEGKTELWSGFFGDEAGKCVWHDLSYSLVV